MLSADKMLRSSLCVRESSILSHYFTPLFNSILFCHSFRSLSFFPLAYTEKDCSFLQSHTHSYHVKILITVHFKQRMRHICFSCNGSCCCLSTYAPSTKISSVLRLDRVRFPHFSNHFPIFEITVSRNVLSANKSL